MHRWWFVAILFAGSAVAFAGAKAEFTDNAKTFTHDCGKQPETVVMGNENTITFTGRCDKVYVPGNKNSITIESVGILLVQGNENKIVAGAVGKISTPGNQNSITWKKSTTASDPTVSDPGTKNTIAKAK